jgi:hypothetical protein
MEEITVLVIRKVTSDCPIAGKYISSSAFLKRETRNEGTSERET